MTDEIRKAAIAIHDSIGRGRTGVYTVNVCDYTEAGIRHGLSMRDKQLRELVEKWRKAKEHPHMDEASGEIYDYVADELEQLLTTKE